jgi:hypothetical protein
VESDDLPQNWALIYLTQPRKPLKTRRQISVSVHCCDRMDYGLSPKCDIHGARADCPDALVAVVEGGYGLLIHDGGSSVIEINFCPWCGSKLPKIGKPKRPA